MVVSMLLSCLSWLSGLTHTLQRCEGEQLCTLLLRNLCTLLDSLGSFQFSWTFQLSPLFLYFFFLPITQLDCSFLHLSIYSKLLAGIGVISKSLTDFSI